MRSCWYPLRWSQWVPIISELRRSRLPRARREGAKVATVLHPRQTGEDIFHIGHRVFAVALARDDERVQDDRPVDQLHLELSRRDPR